MSIHHQAIIKEGAIIAEDATIGPFSIVSSKATIGSRTRIDDSVLIDGRTTIGKDCHIFHGASIGCIPQDLKYAGEDTEVVIGDKNTIREFVTIHRGTAMVGTTEIGYGNLIMAYVHIAHDCRIGNHCVIANSSALAGHIIIEDYAVIGGLVPIHQFCQIGRYSMIGGMTRITKDVVPFGLVAGYPPRVYGLNIVGLRRHNFSNERIDNIKKTFDILFRSGLNVSQALKKIEEDVESNGDITHLINFIGNSKRGIITGIK